MSKISVLVSDIGGTNSRLKLILINKEEDIEPIEIASKVLKSFDYDSIENLLKSFLEEFEGTKNYPKFAVLGIPGAVENNTMLPLVNIPQWKKENGESLAKKLNLKKVIFLNDFVCIGYGILSELKEGETLIKLNKRISENNGKKLVIGPGTGLGVCYLIKNENEKFYNVYGSEGSHQDFAPKNRLQYNYLEYLQNYFNKETISCETACSGPSLIPIYKFLKIIYKDKQPEKSLESSIEAIDANSDKNILNSLNEDIVSKGLDEICPICKLTLEFFVELLGNISGNMSIYTIPLGGIYIVGGLSSTIKKIFESGIFQKAFVKRGEQRDILEKIPINLVLEENIGLIGAIECGKRLVQEEFEDKMS